MCPIQINTWVRDEVLELDFDCGADLLRELLQWALPGMRVADKAVVLETAFLQPEPYFLSDHRLDVNFTLAGADVESRIRSLAVSSGLELLLKLPRSLTA